jgi:hypothetical protein
MAKRYEQEIEEIVRKAGDLRPRTTLRQRLAKVLGRVGLRPSARAGGPLARVTPPMVGGSGAAVLLVALILRSAPIAFAGLGLLLAAYLLAIGRGRGPFRETTGYDKTWRGRPIGGPPDGGGRAKRWFGRRR